MSKPKFTRYRIQEILMSGAGLDLRKARKLTDRIIGAMAAALVVGETVELRGLGSLDVRERAEHRARKPRTGELNLTHNFVRRTQEGGSLPPAYKPYGLPAPPSTGALPP
jgi:nucleoid DNA-binding protein